MENPIDVALILWNADVIQLVSYVLLSRNLKCDGIEPSCGVKKIEELIASRRPRVVIFDLAPPYENSAAVFFRVNHGFPEPGFVITCADPILAIQSAPRLTSYLMLQKPYEPDAIANAVMSLVKESPRFAGKETDFRAFTTKFPSRLAVSTCSTGSCLAKS